jgi:acyl-CoA synthetase (AMP-forming)/AMP-acid ligase II
VRVCVGGEGVCLWKGQATEEGSSCGAGTGLPQNPPPPPHPHPTPHPTPHHTTQAYAMTEASHQMTSNPLPAHGTCKPGTVGKAQGSVRMAVLGAANEELGAGEVGEVCIRGPNVTAGYRSNAAANEHSRVGWGWGGLGGEWCVCVCVCVRERKWVCSTAQRTGALLG